MSIGCGVTGMPRIYVMGVMGVAEAAGQNAEQSVAEGPLRLMSGVTLARRRSSKACTETSSAIRKAIPGRRRGRA